MKGFIQEELQKAERLMLTQIDPCTRNRLDFLRLQKNLYQGSSHFIVLHISHSKNKLIATSLPALTTFETDPLFSIFC